MAKSVENRKLWGHGSCVELWKVPGLCPPHLPGSSSTHLGEAWGGARMLPSKVLPAGKAQAAPGGCEGCRSILMQRQRCSSLGSPASIHAKGPVWMKKRRGGNRRFTGPCSAGSVAGSPSTGYPPLIYRRGNTPSRLPSPPPPPV